MRQQKAMRQQQAIELQKAIDRAESFRADSEEVVFSSGCIGIDRLLPESGLKRGMLVEWLAQVPGSSAGLIGLINCREACRQQAGRRQACRQQAGGQGGMLVVVDQQQSFYPPVALAWGIQQRQLVVVHPTSLADHVWSLVQALESPAVAAVWSAVDRIDSKALQRLRLAAQTGKSLGMLVRTAESCGQPSWSDLQFWVQPISQKVEFQKAGSQEVGSQVALSQVAQSQIDGQLVQIHLARCRGAQAGGSAVIEIDATHGLLRESTASATL